MMGSESMLIDCVLRMPLKLGPKRGFGLCYCHRLAVSQSPNMGVVFALAEQAKWVL